MDMAMRLASKRGGAVSEINVTPMADIMIVLLIIFMIAVPAMRTAPVPLPQARHARDHADDRLVVVITAAGLVSIGANAMPTLEVLEAYVRARVDISREPVPVLVQADGDAEYA